MSSPELTPELSAGLFSGTAHPSTRLTLGILTRNSAATLEETLASIAAQTVGLSHIEMIVVDHHSSDETLQCLQRFATASVTGSGTGNLALRVLIKQSNHLARSRQLVLEMANSPWVAFIDSDVVLPPGWLARAMALCESNAASPKFSGCGGPLILQALAPALRVLPFLQETVVGHGFSRQMQGTGPYTVAAKSVSHLPTAAVVFRKDDLMRIGGFDPRLANCGEDLELGERLTRSGRELWLFPDLAVVHRICLPSRAAWCLRAFRFGRARIRVAQMLPHLFLRLQTSLPVLVLLMQAAMLFFMPRIGLLALLLWPGLLALAFSAAKIGKPRLGAWSWLFDFVGLTFATQLAYAAGELWELVFGRWFFDQRGHRPVENQP